MKRNRELQNLINSNVSKGDVRLDQRDWLEAIRLVDKEAAP